MPGTNTGIFEKAAKGDADIIFLDCEDAVAPDDKEQARKNIVQALNDIDWGSKTMMVRINGLDTHYWYRDVVDIVENLPAPRHDPHPEGRRGGGRLRRRRAGHAASRWRRSARRRSASIS